MNSFRNIGEGPEESQLGFPDSGGTLTFDHPKVTGQAETSLCNLVLLVTIHTRSATGGSQEAEVFLDKRQIPPHLG